MIKRNIAECMIFNKKEEFLLQKKTIDYPSVAKGQWCFFGGEIENGEYPEKAIKRELKEELGIDIKDVELFEKRKYNLKEFHGDAYMFIAHFHGNMSEISLSEGAGFAFFEYSELKDLNIYKKYPSIIEKYLKSKR